MIILRAVYRVIELAQGWRGYLITHEVYFYCLDTAPMIVCMAVWVFGHPGITLPKDVSKVDSRGEGYGRMVNLSFDEGDVNEMRTL